MNQCFDLCGLSRSSEEIKTSLTISDTCTPSSPSRSFSSTARAASRGTQEHQFCGCHKPRSHLAAAPGAVGLLRPRWAQRGPGQDCPAGGSVLSCPIPLPWDLPQSSAGPRLAGAGGASGVEAWGRGGLLPLATGGGAAEAAGWRGSGVLAPRRREGRRRREGERAEELPRQFAEMLL